MKNIENVLQYADNLINLTPIEEIILEGIWEGKKYKQIGEEFHCSESHIKKEAAKLWQKLGQELGEDINKYNIFSKLEKKYRVSQKHNLQIISNKINNSNINICSEKNPFLERKKPDSVPENQKEYPIIDLTEAPEINYNIDRPSELSTLKKWLENKSKLITIYGFSEIGKTALILQLIPEIKADFDYIIYRSFNYKKRPFETLKTEIKQIFNQKNSEYKLIDYWQSFRCLLIIDNLENIFKTSELSGEYLTEYKDYSKFFKQITTNNHQSSVILISWEKPKEINNKTTLHLKGLGEEAKELLRKKGLKDEEKWTELITLYQGHPLWLNNIADTINDYYNGKVSLFLSEHSEVFLDDIETILSLHFDRLSELEKRSLNWLAIQKEAIDSPREFLAEIKSLIRRGLIEKKGTNFIINPIFKVYCRVRNCSD